MYLIAVAMLLFAADDALVVGPARRFEFAPQVELATTTDEATVRLVLPLPQADRSCRIIEIKEEVGKARARRQRDRGKTTDLLQIDVALKPGEPVSIGYRASVELAEYGVAPEVLAAAEGRELPAGDRSKFRAALQLTDNIGKGFAEFDELAKESRSEANTVRRARFLYDAVLERFNYRKELRFKGAEAAWTEATGECGDYVAAFVGLCRRAGIPARPIAGFRFAGDHWEHHVWCEFYITGIGWVPCDLSMGDAGADAADRNFGSISGYCLPLTRDFDIDIAPAIPRQVPLLQEYVFRAQGPEVPTSRYLLNGARLSDAPFDAVEKKSAPARRRSP